MLLFGLLAVSGCIGQSPPADYKTPGITASGTTLPKPDTEITRPEKNLAANSCRFVAISTGPHRSLALRKNGTVAAWGDNTYGQCDVPEGLNHVTAISAGYWHTLALKDYGTVVVWGGKSIASLIKDYGQFSIPSGLKDITAISAGEFHNLALTRNGTIVAWGSNETGESATPLCSYQQKIPG